jgi:hypothetical protein
MRIEGMFGDFALSVLSVASLLPGEMTPRMEVEEDKRSLKTETPNSGEVIVVRVVKS